jgi:anti-anti-sigma regulatory factor
MLDMFRTQMAAARAERYTGLRLVADMDWLLEHPPLAVELQAFEQRLDAVVAEIGATVVCAYDRRHFDRVSIDAALATHHITVGTVERDVGFRVVHAGDAWRIRGEVDMTSSAAFGQAIAVALTGPGAVRLDVSELRFIDVSGLRALADAARGSGRRVRVEGARPVLRRAWTLLAHDRLVPQIEVVG